MKILMAVVTTPEGHVESEPVTVTQVAGVISLTADDGTLFEFDERELHAALFEVAHSFGEAA